jgi:uncharacterized protein
MKFLTALVAGLLFGAGLLVSGMTNPANVLGFLDVAGDWNPALALTMAGAIAVLAPVTHVAHRRRSACNAHDAPTPTRRRIDRALVVGSVLFGLGWGLSGICPGPGLILLTTLAPPAFAFIGAMLVGMLLAGKLPARTSGSDG